MLRASGQTWTTLHTFEADASYALFADLNADGSDDLVLMGTRIRVSYPGQIRLAVGDGSFAPPVIVPAMEAFTWKPGHLDGDGVLDLTGFCSRELGPILVRCGALLSDP